VSLAPAPGSWYGLQPAWQIPLEAGARREHGASLRLDLRLDRVTYQVTIEVPGRRSQVPTEIVFYRRPPYLCWGLAPEEYPRVYAAPGEDSPHRMPDDALCLYYPRSPEHERSRPANGLLAPIDLVRNHLFFEDHWRAAGGHRGASGSGPRRRTASLKWPHEPSPGRGEHRGAPV
jgi:hypothetical protein